MKTIPPIRESVPAGFFIFEKGETPETFVYLEKGELAALVKEKETELFKVNPGELVGVQTLLEKVPLNYSLKATQNSTLLKIDEECLSSILKKIPVWLLASVRRLIQQIKKSQKTNQSIRPENSSRALVAFLLQKTKICIAQRETPIFENYEPILKECSWLTRIPLKNLLEELQSLERRGIVLIHEKGLGIQDPLLLEVLLDYLTAQCSGKDFSPFHLNYVEKRAVHCLSRVPKETKLLPKDWLKLLQSNDKFATLSELNLLEKLGLLQKNDSDFLQQNYTQVNKYLICFKHEKEIKGVFL